MTTTGRRRFRGRPQGRGVAGGQRDDRAEFRARDLNPAPYACIAESTWSRCASGQQACGASTWRYWALLALEANSLASRQARTPRSKNRPISGGFSMELTGLEPVTSWVGSNGSGREVCGESEKVADLQGLYDAASVSPSARICVDYRRLLAIRALVAISA
jgi:hypothetical protein